MSLVQKPKWQSNWFLPGIFEGMWLTFQHLFRNLFNKRKMITLNYPEEKHRYGPRFRGNHVLTVRKDGSIRCTACMLCATACPAQCISIVAAEHKNPEVEKYPISYEIDLLRCVFCGYCEEACPVDAIRMGPEWQVPQPNGTSFIYDIQRLAYRPSLQGGIQSHVDDQERHQTGI